MRPIASCVAGRCVAMYCRPDMSTGDTIVLVSVYRSVQSIRRSEVQSALYASCSLCIAFCFIHVFPLCMSGAVFAVFSSVLYCLFTKASDTVTLGSMLSVPYVSVHRCIRIKSHISCVSIFADLQGVCHGRTDHGSLSFIVMLSVSVCCPWQSVCIEILSVAGHAWHRVSCCSPPSSRTFCHTVPGTQSPCVRAAPRLASSSTVSFHL